MDRFSDLFTKYDFNLTQESVSAEVKRIINENFKKNDVKSVYSQILSFVDITSLNSYDSVESITALVEKLNHFDDEFEILPHPAAICIYPSFISTVKDNLQEDLSIDAVAGAFPHSNTFTEVKIAEVAMSVMEGASEIDVVLPVGMILSENYEEAFNELVEIKDSCRNTKLKVILETGLLQDPVIIKKAAILAMVAGADFIKTSTGKIAKGASLEAVYVMCQAIKEFEAISNNKVGIKVAGGVSETSDAVSYLTVVESILGKDYLTPDLFRFGASRLVNSLLSSLSGKEITYF